MGQAEVGLCPGMSCKRSAERSSQFTTGEQPVHKIPNSVCSDPVQLQLDSVMTPVPVRSTPSGDLDTADGDDVHVVGDIDGSGAQVMQSRDDKRIVVLLNSKLSDEAVSKLKAVGFTVKHFVQYGVFNSSIQALNKIKKWIREGRVVWLHALIKPINYARPTWFTQLCRAAHRAGAQWSLQFTVKPWDVKPFETLRRHKYTSSWSPEGSSTTTYLGSEAVDLGKLHSGAFVELIRANQNCNKFHLSDEWLEERARSDGHPTKKQEREAQNKAAIGGLRSPHHSVTKLQGAAKLGSWLWIEMQRL